MVRDSLLPFALLALGCLTSGHARQEPGLSTQHNLLAFSHTRQLKQTCQDQYQDCPLWAERGLCDPAWVWRGQPLETVVCPFSCLNCTTPGDGNGGGNNGTGGGGGCAGNGNSGGGSLDPNDWLGAHNYYRSLHGVAPLVSDDSLASATQDYANYMASSCDFSHSGTPDTGENIAAGYPDWASSVAGWYNEIVNYDFNNPGWSEATGHFTQVVWASTTNLGCGFATNSSCPNQRYYVCQYLPPGNMEGEYAANVPPLVQDFTRSVEMGQR